MLYKCFAFAGNLLHFQARLYAFYLSTIYAVLTALTQIKQGNFNLLESYGSRCRVVQSRLFSLRYLRSRTDRRCRDDMTTLTKPKDKNCLLCK